MLCWLCTHSLPTFNVTRESGRLIKMKVSSPLILPSSQLADWLDLKNESQTEINSFTKCFCHFSFNWSFSVVFVSNVLRDVSFSARKFLLALNKTSKLRSIFSLSFFMMKDDEMKVLTRMAWKCWLRRRFRQWELDERCIESSSIQLRLVHWAKKKKKTKIDTENLYNYESTEGLIKILQMRRLLPDLPLFTFLNASIINRPVSAYALFFRDTQAAIKGQNPSASFGEVSKIVASMWDVLAPEHKNVSFSFSFIS